MFEFKSKSEKAGSGVERAGAGVVRAAKVTWGYEQNSKWPMDVSHGWAWGLRPRVLDAPHFIHRCIGFCVIRCCVSLRPSPISGLPAVASSDAAVAATVAI